MSFEQIGVSGGFCDGANRVQSQVAAPGRLRDLCYPIPTTVRGQ
jgi:hypothetical protein